MKHNVKALLALAAALTVVPAASLMQVQAQNKASAADRESRALNALEASREYLRSLRSFEVRAQTTIQEVLDDDTKVDLVNRVRYEYRAPDRLAVAWQSDRGERRLYFDGRTLAVFAPRVGYFAQVQAPGTVAQLLRRAAQDYDVIFPLPDLFYWAASDAPVYDIQRAVYVGPSRILDVDTDQYLFRQGDVDWQVWIQRGERPVPRKIVITDRSDPAQPSLTALLQWNPDVPLGDDRFVFAPPEGARPIEMASLPRETAR